MTSLLDIGPLTEEVAIGKKTITVQGVTPEGFFYLMAKFPPLQSLFSGVGAKLSMDDLQTMAPGCIAYILAVATTDRAQCLTIEAWRETLEQASAVALRLSAHYQAVIFQAALDLTFPDGVGPFMKAMDRLAQSINRVSGQTVPATASSKPSRSGFVMDSRGMRLGRGAQSVKSSH